MRCLLPEGVVVALLSLKMQDVAVERIQCPFSISARK